jgi:hypothetical protein
MGRRRVDRGAIRRHLRLGLPVRGNGFCGRKELTFRPLFMAQGAKNALRFSWLLWHDRGMDEHDKTPCTCARRKVFLKSWGCQMNVYDTGRMLDIVTRLGYAPTDVPDEADLVIFNTCHIREKASEKLFSELGRLHKKLKAAGRTALIAVGGCVAQAEGAELQKRMPYVDLVSGPQS